MIIFRLSTVLSTMAVAITTCAALPASSVAAIDAGTLDVITATMWKDINWKGASIKFSITTQSQCYGLSGGEWTNTISSIQVPAGYRCRLWDSNSCNGDSSPDIYAPGAYALGGMNDKATSFKCYKN